uniref:Histone-lysine N-methyltransferase ASH1L n=1 Tax=Knipowitschia caucasica TaxID=637954 RepID=A0AAV2MCS7_KNICA
MDQRVKGGSPPKAKLDGSSETKSSEKDHVPEKKRKSGAEDGGVLELLIEGRCGTKGDQQLQISGKDTNCPEGNVRLRIGLQAKRTKKPPKILESYVCKPTIRTYQRQGRGSLRGEAEGGMGHQSKSNSSPDEAISREQHSGLDGVQSTTKQTAPAPPSSTPSAPATASVTAVSVKRNRSSSQVPIKLAEKAEVISKASRPCPKKRGRPPKRPLPDDYNDHAEKGNRQLNIRRSFGGKLGPQINVSKRGTIYMGKRRGRKPKVQSAISHSLSQPSLFTSAPETSLFSQPLASHPFPSPSLTHSSGAQSPFSEHSFTDPSPCLLFSQPFSLPSPSSSCTSPRPPSSSSFSSFVRKSCPCQGRPHFPFHQSTCKLSTPISSLQHAPGSPPGHLKEATTSPRSESHSEETLPSDSGIGTDNNSISERGEIRGSRGILRVGHSSGLIIGSQKHPATIRDHPTPVSPALLSRQPNPNAHRDRHRHRRRDFDCSSSCACLCACPGQSKCVQPDFYSCHNALKRQKSKHKKKHQQHMHLQDPEFLSELEELIALFSEMHIGRRSWARAGLVHNFDGGSPGGRRHHPSHSMRSNIFCINLNGFYSPHPSAYSHNPSIPTQPFYSCHPVHCGRKVDRRQCGCSAKFQDSMDNMYRSYPGLYNHLPSSYPLPSPHFTLHQSPHFFMNPARFHRRRNRTMRDAEEDSARGSGHLGSGLTSNFPCACGRTEHKHKHKHRHRHCDEEDDVREDEVERERTSPVHTNLFTSAAVESGARGLRWGGDRPWRRDEPAWMERRETGTHNDSRTWGQHKTLQPIDHGSVHKRRPGRPRKHHLSSSTAPPAHSTSSGFMSVCEVQAGTEVARSEPALLMTEAELQAKSKKGRQRRHSPSPLHQSVTEDRVDSDSPTESSEQSDVEETPSQPVSVPTEEHTDSAPIKNFLQAGLYSDDYKTTDPPSPSTHFGTQSTEYSPEEQDYSLLPAPIHVGKYLRMKRLHFQLPYEVMWQWQHDQLCRPPVVPLKRKRRTCRPKEKTSSSHNNEDQSGDITSLFPHLDMDPLSSCERSFVVEHHVFLLRNWELVRERQIRLRIQRERLRDSEEEEEEEEHNHNMSDQPTGKERVLSDSSKTPSDFLAASPSPAKAQSGPDEREADKRGEKELIQAV